LAGVVGPAIGAGVVAVGGPASAFALNGFSFIVAVGCVWWLVRLLRSGQFPSTPMPAPHPAALANPLRDLRDGLALVAASPWLWMTITIFSLVNITLASPRQVALPFLVEETMRADVGTLGLLYSAGSVGAVAGALWLGRASRLRRRGWLAYGGTVVCGLAAMVFGLWPLLPAVLAAALVIGLSNSTFGLVWTNTLQEMVPRAALGRVSSIDALGSFVLLPVGAGLAGWATDLVGPPLVFIVGGAATALLGVAGLLHPAIRNLD
jgi:DHA3 family tetracycline resistance protein-like MFS transporter